MARQEFKVGTVNGGDGDPLYLVGQKLNSNFTQLFSLVSGGFPDNELPVAIPIEAGGTGAVTVAQARTKLGLTSAATTTVGEVQGNLLALGTFNIGIDSLSTSTESTDTVGNGRKSAEIIHYYDTDRTVLTLGGPESSVSTQLGITITEIPKLSVRSSPNTSWGEWADVFHSLNTVTTYNGYLKPAEYFVRLYNDKIVTNLPDAVFTKTATGVYKISKAVLATKGWVYELPRSALGLPLIGISSISYASEAITVNTVGLTSLALNSTATDIPSDVWIDIKVTPLP